MDIPRALTTAVTRELNYVKKLNSQALKLDQDTNLALLNTLMKQLDESKVKFDSTMQKIGLIDNTEDFITQNQDSFIDLHFKVLESITSHIPDPEQQNLNDSSPGRINATQANAKKDRLLNEFEQIELYALQAEEADQLDTHFIQFQIDSSQRLRDRICDIMDDLRSIETIQHKVEKLNDDETQFIARVNVTLRSLFAKQTSAKSIHKQNQSDSNKMNDIKIKPMEIAAFDGKPENWITFHDSFLTIVHNNPKLQKVAKFNHLKQSITDTYSPIKKMPITDEGYDSAWKLVVQTYNNPRYLIENSFKSLFAIKKMSEENDTEMLRVCSESETIYDTINRMPEKFDKFSAIFAVSVLGKLDSHSRDLYETETDGKIPQWETLQKFLEKRRKVLLTLPSHSKQLQSKPATAAAKTVKSMNSQVQKKFHPCQLCQQEHWISRCQLFKDLDIETRQYKIKSLNLCENCFGEHSIQSCTSKFVCQRNNCKQKHHTMLHKDSPTVTSATNVISLTTEIPVTHSYVMLSTAMINIKAPNGLLYKLRALIDSGSQGSFIRKCIAEDLRLPKRPTHVIGTGLGNKECVINEIATAVISTDHGDLEYKLDFYVHKRITKSIPSRYIQREPFMIPAAVKLADPLFNVPGEIDILIGNEIAQRLNTGKVMELPSGILMVETIFGWTMSGSVQLPIDIPQQPSISISCQAGTLQDLRNSIEKFYKVEDYKQSDRFLTHEEQYCEELFEKTHKRLDNGQFQVVIPYKNDVDNLTSNYGNALVKLNSMNTRMKKNPDLSQQVSKFMTEYEELGHMTRIDISQEDKNRQAYYFPYHAVLKPTSSTTKLRVVFDGSSKTDSSLSLNDTQCVGPNCQTDSSSLLVNFRFSPFVAMADIEKMYRTILVDPSQRNLQRILIRDNDGKVQVYELNTVTYGTSAASFQATRCLKQLALDSSKKFPLASKDLAENSYVDDIIFGSSTEEDLIQRANDLIAITQSAQMNLRKFNSNSKNFLDSIPESKREDVSEDNSTFKALGVLWNSRQDEIGFVIKPSTEIVATKRNVFSEISKLYDPNGLLGPVIFNHKQFMKGIYELKSSWDEKLPQSKRDEWTNLAESMESLSTLRIPRCSVISNYIELQLHGFSDASIRGFGACIFIRSTDACNNVMMSLIMSKSRISSAEARTPRLELCGGVILAHLMTQVSRIHPTISDKFCHMDSTISLHWISKQPANLKDYVNNRVAEIQKFAGDCKWRHIEGEINPADLLSRGLQVPEIVESKLWWQGPEFLKFSRECWPKSIIEFDFKDPQYICEFKQQEILVNASLIDDENIVMKLIGNEQLFWRIKKKVAYVHRFITNIRARISKTEPRVGKLRSADYYEAEIIIVRINQIKYLQPEYEAVEAGESIKSNSKLRKLSPIWDPHYKLMRANGRLANADLDYDQRFPFIVPNSRFAKLLIRDTHISNMHSAELATVAFVNQRHWPLHAQDTARLIIHQCHRCYRMRPKKATQFMAPLPRTRVNPSKPFTHCGVDYAGPFKVKESLLRKPVYTDAYLAIFVCFSTKATHIELARSATTKDFFLCFTRFIGRRGKPKTMYSDGGPNFVGAKNELHDISNFLIASNSEFTEFFRSQEIDWQTIPPASPEFGGLWEADVKRVKYHLFIVIGTTRLTSDELYTICVQIEAMLNSRPLTPLSKDPHDISALTPGHFLIGEEMNAKPEHDLVDAKVTTLERYYLTIKMQQQFWQRFSREYVRTLQMRGKNYLKKTDVKVGQIVMLCDEKFTPSYCWPLAVITEVHPGRDGLVRIVTIRTSTQRVLTRPITKLAFLPESSELI